MSSDVAFGVREIGVVLWHEWLIGVEPGGSIAVPGVAAFGATSPSARVSPKVSIPSHADLAIARTEVGFRGNGGIFN